jgi:hypothetical protein
VVLTGDTRMQAFRQTESFIEINGGTVGAGGTGDFTEDEPLGLAILSYDVEPRFQPRSVDLVEIDVRSGSARAEREVVTVETATS